MDQSNASQAALELKSLKERERRAALARRDALDPAFRTSVATRLADLAGELPLPAGALIGGFLAIRSEIDPLPLLARLADRGQKLALPVVMPDRETMIFRHWPIGDPLEKASFGLSVPPESQPVVEPRILLVPLAAYDRRGYRIGYGKGHYDRAIERLELSGPVLKIGIAFSAQEIDAVPAEPHDRPLDFLLTENGLTPCGDRN